MGVGEAIVTGVVAEVVDGDPIGESWERKAPLHDPLIAMIGGGGVELRGGVLGEEIERSDELLRVGEGEIDGGGEAEIVGEGRRRGESGGDEETGEEEEREKEREDIRHGLC